MTSMLSIYSIKKYLFKILSTKSYYFLQNTIFYVHILFTHNNKWNVFRKVVFRFCILHSNFAKTFFIDFFFNFLLKIPGNIFKYCVEKVFHNAVYKYMLEKKVIQANFQVVNHLDFHCNIINVKQIIYFKKISSFTLSVLRWWNTKYCSNRNIFYWKYFI